MNLFSKLFRSRYKPKDYLSVHWPFYLVELPPGEMLMKGLPCSMAGILSLDG